MIVSSFVLTIYFLAVVNNIKSRLTLCLNTNHVSHVIFMTLTETGFVGLLGSNFLYDSILTMLIWIAYFFRVSSVSRNSNQKCIASS